jgi:hypothetical protein
MGSAVLARTAYLGWLLLRLGGVSSPLSWFHEGVVCGAEWNGIIKKL